MQGLFIKIGNLTKWQRPKEEPFMSMEHGSTSFSIFPIASQFADYDMLGFELAMSQQGSNNFRFQKQERIFDYDLRWDLFKFRPSDSQIGRFIQIDPMASDFAHNSPYALQENKFGLGVELEGRELAAFLTKVGDLNLELSMLQGCQV